MAYQNIDGKISRLYVNSANCSIRVHGHGSRYFTLDLKHPNYAQIYATLLSSSLTGQSVRLRLGDYEPPNEPASNVVYLVADFPDNG